MQGLVNLIEQLRIRRKDRISDLDVWVKNTDWGWAGFSEYAEYGLTAFQGLPCLCAVGSSVLLTKPAYMFAVHTEDLISLLRLLCKTAYCSSCVVVKAALRTRISSCVRHTWPVLKSAYEFAPHIPLIQLESRAVTKWDALLSSPSMPSYLVAGGIGLALVERLSAEPFTNFIYAGGARPGDGLRLH